MAAYCVYYGLKASIIVRIDVLFLSGRQMDFVSTENMLSIICTFHLIFKKLLRRTIINHTFYSEDCIAL